LKSDVRVIIFKILNVLEMHKPLISVITVCLNSEEFIEQCIQSVISQEFSDFEYIIIDGGSSDNTVNIIKKYQNKISYWQSKSDRGIAHAFNQGIERSSGDWILFLNSDDYLAGTNVLSQMAQNLKTACNADVIFGQIQRVARLKQARAIGVPYGGAFSWRKFILRDTIPHPAAFTRRSYFERVGLFNKAYRIAMDYEHYLRGGPRLDARFVPVLVSNMRDGGISRQDFSAVLDEWEHSHIDAGQIPVWRVKMMRWFLQTRHLFGLIWRYVWPLGLRDSGS
jgi:glycosyltransferase involved in cell wall biosynthesis